MLRDETLKAVRLSDAMTLEVSTAHPSYTMDCAAHHRHAKKIDCYQKEVT